MLRTKLSLNTEKNWHQNKPAKRRARRSEASIGNGGSGSGEGALMRKFEFGVVASAG
jgi:hypothetical protein